MAIKTVLVTTTYKISQAWARMEGRSPCLKGGSPAVQANCRHVVTMGLQYDMASEQIALKLLLLAVACPFARIFSIAR